MAATNLNHASVSATDLAASTRFYVELFGMEVLPTPNFGFPVRWLRVGEHQFHLFERPGAAPAYHHVALTVDRLEPVYAAAKRLDCLDRTAFGHFLYELPGDCAQLYLRDPAGNLIEVDALGASQLPESIRRDMKPLADVQPQDEENLKATLFHPPRVSRRARVAVVGGSLGGLTAALLLRDGGYDVDVFERSASELSGFGAGIVLHEATVRYFRERTSIDVEDISVGSTFLRYLDPTGAPLYEEPSAYRYTSWGTLYRRLLELFGEERYHRGAAFVGFDQDADGVELQFASTRDGDYEAVVFADGIMSTARRLLLPYVEPRYAGYVGWRGTVDEAELTGGSIEAVRDAITYGVVDHSHVLAYPIPSPNGRRLNFVWYRNVASGEPLTELMTGRDGAPRPISLPPGEVREEHVRELRDASSRLPPPLGEVVAKAEQPFLQVVVDIEVPRMAFGRVCLIGDAAFAARPHAAAGTAKAAENAWKLAEAVAAADGDLVAALALWEPAQLELGRRLVARSREMGERYQLDGSWDAADPRLRFGLYGPGR